MQQSRPTPVKVGQPPRGREYLIRQTGLQTGGEDPNLLSAAGNLYTVGRRLLRGSRQPRKHGVCGPVEALRLGRRMTMDHLSRIPGRLSELP